MTEPLGFFIVIPEYVIRRVILKAAVLYGMILGLSARDGYCSASNQYLAKRLSSLPDDNGEILRNVQPETISRLVSELVNKDFIRREIVGNQRRLYPCIQLRGCSDRHYPLTKPSTPLDETVKHSNKESNKDNSRLVLSNLLLEDTTMKFLEKKFPNQPLDLFLKYIDSEIGKGHAIPKSNKSVTWWLTDTIPMVAAFLQQNPKIFDKLKGERENR